VLLKAYEDNHAIIATLPFDVTSLGKTLLGARLMIHILGEADMK
jgi:hypothetical protein